MLHELSQLREDFSQDHCDGGVGVYFNIFLLATQRVALHHLLDPLMEYRFGSWSRTLVRMLALSS